MTNRRVAAILVLITGAITGAAGLYLRVTVQLAYMTSHGSAWVSPVREQLQRDATLGAALIGIALVLIAAGLALLIGSGRRGAPRRGA